LQPILGVGKKNPVFSVHQHNKTNDYHMYYGLELFEVVPAYLEDTRFKLMLAHLHNAGIALTKLQKCFHLDPRTIQGWSKALKSGDAQMLARALAGRKLTRPIEHYVRLRFSHRSKRQPIYLENTDNYQDMCQRFKDFEERMRTRLLISADRALTWVIDRGIFSNEIFDWVLSSTNIHMIGTARCGPARRVVWEAWLI
jgi:hypothetical protein